MFPKTALAISRAAQVGNADEAARLSGQLEPLWAMFSQHGSLRVVAAAAELRRLVGQPSLPLPLKALAGPNRDKLSDLLEKLALTE